MNDIVEKNVPQQNLARHPTYLPKKIILYREKGEKKKNEQSVFFVAGRKSIPTRQP